MRYNAHLNNIQALDIRYDIHIKVSIQTLKKNFTCACIPKGLARGIQKTHAKYPQLSQTQQYIKKKS